MGTNGHILAGGVTRRAALAAGAVAALAAITPARALAGEGDEEALSASSGGNSLKLERLSGDDRYATAAAIARRAFKEPGFAILASGENFPDALSSAAMSASFGEMPVLLTARDSLPAATAEALADLGGPYVYIVGGYSAVGSAVERALDAVVGERHSRICDATRQLTAVQVSREVSRRWSGAVVDGVPKTAVVASGSKPWDSLSVGPFCYATRSPIFLAEGDGSLGAATLSAIEEFGPERVVVVGGEASVGRGAEGRLGRYGVERWAGADRYETSRVIAERSAENGCSWAQVAVASGENFPDALAGAPLMGARRGLLLLTPPGDASAAAAEISRHGSSLERLFVLGGEGAVSSAAESGLKEALGARRWVADGDPWDEPVYEEQDRVVCTGCKQTFPSEDEWSIHNIEDHPDYNATYYHKSIYTQTGTVHHDNGHWA